MIDLFSKVGSFPPCLLTSFYRIALQFLHLAIDTQHTMMTRGHLINQSNRSFFQTGEMSETFLYPIFFFSEYLSNDAAMGVIRILKHYSIL